MSELTYLAQIDRLIEQLEMYQQGKQASDYIAIGWWLNELAIIKRSSDHHIYDLQNQIAELKTQIEALKGRTQND